MKAYTLFSPSHAILYDNYFIRTLPQEFELDVTHVPQECSSANFYSEGWATTCYRKVELFYKACKENMGGFFVFFDPDIQFFGNVKDIMLEELGECDIACQDDLDTFSSGQFICRCNDNTLYMFNRMLENYRLEDQTTLNDHLYMCKHKFLSRRFFTYAHFFPGVWQGKDFDIPDDIITHHANWVVGVENKMNILDIVRRKYNRKVFDQ